jgi:hypothetical protein
VGGICGGVAGGGEVGGTEGGETGLAGEVTLRSTLGTAAAAGSASKKSRGRNPKGPAIRAFGIVAIAVL